MYSLWLYFPIVTPQSQRNPWCNAIVFPLESPPKNARPHNRFLSRSVLYKRYIVHCLLGGHKEASDRRCVSETCRTATATLALWCGGGRSEKCLASRFFTGRPISSNNVTVRALRETSETGKNPHSSTNSQGKNSLLRILSFHEFGFLNLWVVNHIPKRCAKRSRIS